MGRINPLEGGEARLDIIGNVSVHWREKGCIGKKIPEDPQGILSQGKYFPTCSLGSRECIGNMTYVDRIIQYHILQVNMNKYIPTVQ